MELHTKVLLQVALCCAVVIAATSQQLQPTRGEKLGTVDFPVSCEASQQATFNRGIALLHDFWYDRAEHQFQEIVKADPTCAMAYWGEAMSLWHQIWDRPNEATLKRGLALVQQAQKVDAKTQRERDYINALAQF